MREFMRTIIAPLDGGSVIVNACSRGLDLPDPGFGHSGGSSGVQQGEGVEGFSGGGKHTDVLVLQECIAQCERLIGACVGYGKRMSTSETSLDEDQLTASSKACGETVHASTTLNLISDDLPALDDALLDMLRLVETNWRVVASCSNDGCGGQSVAVDNNFLAIPFGSS